MTTCFGSVKARVIRLTRLDSCGDVATGSAVSVVSNGFVSVEISPEYEDGEDFLQKNAWGDFCVDDYDDTRLRRVGLSIEFCKVDPDVLDIVANSRSIVSGSDNVGAAFGESAVSERFALEAWTKVPGACGPEGQQWVYWVWPNVGNGKIGSITLELATATFPMEAMTKGAAASWSDGPYGTSMLPAGEEILEGEHWAFGISAAAPPDASCGAVAVT